MKTFFVNKYPIVIGYEDGHALVSPIGTIFKIYRIKGNFFELKPISKKVEVKTPILVDPPMLDIGFTQQDPKDLTNGVIMKPNYFDESFADPNDGQLIMAKMQGYVPRDCLLGGVVVWSEVDAGRNPCDGCSGPREKCDGKQQKD